MDCLSPSSPVQRVVFMKGSQVGATEAGNGWLGYIIHQAPGPIMGVAPTVELAKRGSPGAGQGAPQPRLWQYGAQQGVPGRGADPDRRQQRRRAALHAGAVSPILLAERRSATFQRRKILLVSTPKTRGRSRIEREYEASALALDVAGIGVDLVEEGDQRRFFVPCPHCGEHQTLELANLRWPEGRPREAECGCSHCGSLIGERHKTAMLERSEWRPTAEGAGRTAGFHLSSLYSPVGWFSWADAAEMYEQAQKVPDLIKGFVNTVLGLPYEEEAEAPEWQRLYERRESYRIGIVPEGGLFLTAGVDVQKDRIEVEIVAWGRGKESWSVDYRVIDGDTARPEVWVATSARAWRMPLVALVISWRLLKKLRTPERSGAGTTSR
jgi:phage terminase large subunit GpA-like protein